MNREIVRLGIVIIGFNNSIGITRLLASLDNVDFCSDKDITLIFSIDYSGNDNIVTIAQNYQWRYGQKIICAYDVNLGLQTHILKCGDYLSQHNLDAIAVLEDDIYLSPVMYKYMKASVRYYIDDPQIAGISLYKHEINLFAKKTFIDYMDGNDVFFIQYAQSWGQIWLKDKWKDFKNWYDHSKWEDMDQDLIPSNIKKWSNSWLKYHIMYCIDKNLFFVYPRQSLTTNFSDAGTHRSSSTTKMQVPLLMQKHTDWFFTKVEDSNAVYDAFFENITILKSLGLDDVLIDLYGVKNEKKRYLVSEKILPYKIIRSWGLCFRPVENNILLNCPGDDLFLYDTSLTEHKKPNKYHSQRVFDYDLRGINIFSKSCADYVWSRMYSSLCYKITRLIKRMKKHGGV